MSNLPSDSVRKIIIAGNLPHAMEETLQSYGVECIRTEPIKGLPIPLSRHTDMQLVSPYRGLIVFAPGTSTLVLEALKGVGYELVPGESELTGTYPGDVAYNCAVVGSRAFLNPRYTDKRVLELLNKNQIHIVHVKQGYAKCSILILTAEAIVTADPSIHRAALQEGLDSLLIPPQLKIRLEGYSYGFIGGSAGLISPTQMVFFGDYSLLDSWNLIHNHFKKHGVTPMALSPENLVDLGGLIPLCSV